MFILYEYSLSDWDLSAQVEQVTSLITHMLETMIKDAPHYDISTKRKAIATIFHFAISLERDGQQGMFDLALQVLRHAPGLQRFMWSQAQRHTDALFQESSAPSLNRAIVHTSPHRPWNCWNENEVARWATAVLAVPYTEEVGQSVVSATLQIAYSDLLRPYIPIGVWELFKRQLSVPPLWEGQWSGTKPDIIRHVRGLGDIEILKSLFLLVWSEWGPLFDSGLTAMEISIREDFRGPGMRQHREDLVQRLDHILGELVRGPEYFRGEPGVYSPKNRIRKLKEQYTRLKEVLLEVEREAAMEPTPCTSPRLTPFQR